MVEPALSPMDKARTDGNPRWRNLKRQAKLSGLLVAVVFAVASIPVIVLYVFLPGPESDLVSGPLHSTREAEVRFRNGDITLAGTLTLPATPGPHPAIVVVHGSGRTSRRQMQGTSRFFAPQGIAVLTYDKRGVGDSQGQYSNVGTQNSEAMLPILAGDALAGVQLLREHLDIDPERVGLLGYSQAGWIIPIAAAAEPDLAFTVIVSGPTVSVGEEIFFSRLTGDDAGQPTQLTDEEVREKLSDYDGPFGFRPLGSLQSMASPGLWVFGGRDRSIQIPESIEILERLIDEAKPFTYRLHPTGSHGLIDARTGERIPIFPEILQWIRDQIGEH